jgi:hypothetical protein
MWGAIIQAIDHALGRMHEGAGAGIKVANSQHGGGAPISNMDSGAGNAAKQDLRNQQETTSEQDEAAEKAKIGSNASSTGEVPSEGGQSQGGAGALGNIGGGADAGESAGGEEAAESASDILSDANAKTAQNASSLSGWRAYGAGVGQGMANAGAVAQGKQPAKWEDINKDNAKNAAEKVVKGWKKKDFSKSPDDQQNAQQGQ